MVKSDVVFTLINTVLTPLDRPLDTSSKSAATGYRHRLYDRTSALTPLHRPPPPPPPPAGGARGGGGGGGNLQ
jgi:hypothetical protein